MEIQQTRATRGPNYFSVSDPNLIVCKVDLGEAAARLTNSDGHFSGRLQSVLPEGEVWRRFLDEVLAGIPFTSALEFVALELQHMAGMRAPAFRLSEATAEAGVFNIIFGYEVEEAGRYAIRKAVVLLDVLLGEETLDGLKEDIERWVETLNEIYEEFRFGPSTEALVEEARRRGIPHLRLNSASLVQLGYGRNSQRIRASVTENTRIIAVDLVGNKHATKEMLATMSMPVPGGTTITHVEDLEHALKEVGYPVAIKPLDANQGKGITTAIRDLEAAKAAFVAAQAYSNDVIIERSLVGDDYRALVVNYKLVSVAKREPAHVIGDGTSTIAALVAKVNEDPRRGFGHESSLTKIKIDELTLRILAAKEYTPETVLAEGEHCALKKTANLSTGGTATDVTDEVHPSNVALFERIAHFVGLDVAGIDIVSPALSIPLAESGGGIVEVNAAPGLRMHLAPSSGTPRNVAEPVLDMLFPPGTSARIPILAVTGTNGKTTTTRLLAHIIRGTGKMVGYTTSNGVHVGNYLVASGDTTGPVSAQMVLKDPTVEVAVLETARGGMVRSGLAFDQCDIGVVTNITLDHLGQKDIQTLEQMTRVKSIIPRVVRTGGYAILNADDDRVLAMREGLGCNVALFSLRPDNEHVIAHTEAGGFACILSGESVVIKKGRWSLPVEKVIDIPITFSGRAVFMIQNVLAATLAAYCHGVKIDDIRSGLTTFEPSVAQSPGRLNLVDFGTFSVLIDFAHNAAGLEAIEKFLNAYPATRKVAISGGVGDRRDDDIREVGQIIGRTFDAAVVRENDDLRGRALGETADLFIEGLKRSKPDMPVEKVFALPEAIRHALDHAEKGDLIAILGGDIELAIKVVQEYREKKLPVPSGSGN